ncbi:MAG: hypothetical protein EBS19_14565 [Spirochaetia bacterium]|nr:hypothetical protein [Spirochaetia bacterium]
MKGKKLYYKSIWNKIPLSPGEEEEILSSPYADAYTANKAPRNSNFNKAAKQAITGKQEKNVDVFNYKYSTSINRACHQTLEHIIDFFNLDANNPRLNKFNEVDVNAAKQETCDVFRTKLDKEWAQIYCDKVKKLKDFKTLYQFLIFHSQF